MPTVSQPVRIVIADDHRLVREGLRRLLELQPEFTVVGEAADGVEALQQVKDLKPDVLLLDVAMPRLNGLDVARQLGRTLEEVRTVLLTASIEPEEAVRALRLGVRGIVMKDSAAQTLYKCIRAIMNGEYWVAHDRVNDLLHSLREVERASSQEAPPASRLTQRELQVISAIIDGATNRDIGKSLGLSEQTVKNHLSNIYDKLGVSSRLELALYAVHHRLLADDRPGLPTPAPPAASAHKAPAKKPR